MQPVAKTFYQRCAVFSPVGIVTQAAESVTNVGTQSESPKNLNESNLVELNSR